MVNFGLVVRGKRFSAHEAVTSVACFSVSVFPMLLSLVPCSLFLVLVSPIHSFTIVRRFPFHDVRDKTFSAHNTAEIVPLVRETGLFTHGRATLNSMSTPTTFPSDQQCRRSLYLYQIFFLIFENVKSLIYPGSFMPTQVTTKSMSIAVIRAPDSLLYNWFSCGSGLVPALNYYVTLSLNPEGLLANHDFLD